MTLARRTFIKGMMMTAAGVLPAGCQAMRERPEAPNIVVCVADDWSYGFPWVDGGDAVQTPIIDGLAAEGVLFSRAYCIAPTCSAARAGILTGQPPHRLEQAANLWGTLPAKFDVYPDLLVSAGYVIGQTGKGYGPAINGDRSRNPAGPSFQTFDAFLATVPPDRPFCYWFGSLDPHRPYDPELARTYALRSEEIRVPPFLPDAPEVRQDLLDYSAEIRRFDADVGTILAHLEAIGRCENTLVVITSDNGLPFPRAKANLYEAGTHVPLILRFPRFGKPGRICDALVSHLDLAPTFLELAGLDVASAMTGKSLLDLLTSDDPAKRERLFLERERHARVRANNVGYPCRAIRTDQYLFIRNFVPERWPAGDPDNAGPLGPFGDIDPGPTKAFLLDHREDPQFALYFHLACDKRSSTELYDVIADPWQVVNVGDNPRYGDIRDQLSVELTEWMISTDDPRATDSAEQFDLYPYFGTL